MTRDLSSPIKAVVDKVLSGSHGAYAVAMPVEMALSKEVGRQGVTFSLEPEDKVWEEEKKPKPGDVVILHEVRERRLGWRAERAHFNHLKPA